MCKIVKKLLIIVGVLAYKDASSIELAMNHSVPREFINKTTAWAIFSRQVKTWSNGTPVTVFVLKGSHPLHGEFTKTVLDTFPYQLKRSWDRKVFSGTGQAPIEVNSIEDMFTHIVNTPGSIGYLPDKWDGDSVKTLKLKPNRQPFN